MTRPNLRCAVVATTIALVVATCATGPSTTATAAPASRGAELYTRHCAVCHGDAGDADTITAQLLLPRPTAFRLGLFKLVSTQNGMPTDDDLVATLRRGMPGSTMMSWSWLPEEDLRALAQEVRRLAARGRAESIFATAQATGRTTTFAAAVAEAERELAPGPAVEVGQPIEVTDQNLAAGERLYAQHCAGCHGSDGRGLPQGADWPTDGTWLWPRDFTAGYLRGDTTWRDLTCRVRAGMPGAHMPPVRLSAAETDSLVSFVKSLIPEEATAHHTQWRRTLRVQRTQTLPARLDDAAWTRLERLRLPLAPLWWRPEAPAELWLTAAHDGTDVVLRLEWADATHDAEAQPTSTISDGAAIQFAAATLDPPLFAMGSPQQPVNVWRWHAFDPKDLAGIADLLSPTHTGLDVPLGAVQPRPRAESLAFEGPASARAATGTGLPLQVATEWAAGRWTATFRRSLRARSDQEVDLTGTTPVLFAFAIWDGRIDHHAGSKAITTWHVLALER
ncbi:MAG: c-type cytochrome [Planctomycetes bacterium]|nr:c-type cytochrome [Planctomycetota bacterium]